MDFAFRLHSKCTLAAMLSTKSALSLSLLLCLCTAVEAQNNAPAADKTAEPPAGSGPAPVEKAAPAENKPADVPESTPPEVKAEPEEKVIAPAEAQPATTEPMVPPALPPQLAENKAEPSRASPAPVENDFRLMTGVHGGLVIPFNGIHSVGYKFGMTLDYTFLRRYGVHFGAETGLLPARAQTLAATPSNISVIEGGTFGFLNLRLTGMYVFPKIWDLNPSAGFGLSYYQLSGGSYSFQASIAPVAVGSLYYDILPNLQLGVIGQFILATTGKITTTGSDYTLKSATWLTTASLAVSVRYAWF